MSANLNLFRCLRARPFATWERAFAWCFAAYTELGPSGISGVRKPDKHRHRKSQCNYSHTPGQAQILKPPVQRAVQIFGRLSISSAAPLMKRSNKSDSERV